MHLDKIIELAIIQIQLNAIPLFLKAEHLKSVSSAKEHIKISYNLMYTKRIPQLGVDIPTLRGGTPMITLGQKIRLWIQVQSYSYILNLDLSLNTLCKIPDFATEPIGKTILTVNQYLC